MSHVRTATRVTLLPTQAGPAITLILLAPIAPAVADYFGPGGTTAAQQVVTFPLLGLMIGSLLSGFAIRLAGLKRLVLLASAAFVVSGVIGLVAAGLPLLLAGGVLLGLGAAWLTSSLSAITSILYDGEERARLVGWQSACDNLIAVTLGLCTAVLAGRFGWRTPFGAYLLFGAAMLLLAALFIPSLPRSKAGSSAKMLSIFVRVWPTCLAGAAIYAIATNQSTNLPFLLVEHGLTTPGLRSLVVISTPCAAMLGSVAYAAAQGHLGDRTMMAIAGAAGAAGWLIFGSWTGGLVFAMAGAACLGFGIGVVMPIMFTRVMRAVPGEASGTAVGLLSAGVFLGSFASPVLFAPLRDSAGLSGMMWWLALATLGVAGVGLAWRRPKLAAAAA